MRGGINRGEEGEGRETRETVDVWERSAGGPELGRRDALSWRTKEWTFEWRKKRAKTSRRAGEVCIKMNESPQALKVISLLYSACERRCASCETAQNQRSALSSSIQAYSSCERRTRREEKGRKERTLEMNGVTASWCESSTLAGLPPLPVSPGLASFLPTKKSSISLSSPLLSPLPPDRKSVV